MEIWRFYWGEGVKQEMMQAIIYGYILLFLDISHSRLKTSKGRPKYCKHDVSSYLLGHVMKTFHPIQPISG